VCLGSSLEKEENMKSLFLPLCAVLVFGTANAQWVQQGNKLVGIDAVNTPYPASQGVSVSLSADGNTAIEGGYGDNGNIGAAWVFTRTNGVWAQQGNKLVPTDNAGTARLGASVSLSADGNTALVGGNVDDGTGAAWVFIRTSGVWSQQGAKLIGTAAVGNAGQGVSVSLSADGNTALVAGISDDGGAGAVWVFTRTGDTWTQQGSKLVGAGAVGKAQQGISVSLSGDGNTALVGGHYDSDSAGAAWVFTRSGSTWSQQGEKLVGTGAVNTPRAARQGRAVAISGDGNTAIVGGWYDNGFAGAAWVFTRTNGVWSQQGAKLVATNVSGNVRQSRAVSISGDGNTAIVSGHDDGDAGAAFIFRRSNDVWSERSKLVGTGAVGDSRQGLSLFISSDGNTAILGGNNDDSAKGAAWVFQNIPTSVVGDPAPQMFKLMQNYPNPLNPNTVITYQLPAVNFVSLKVLDVLGREVATLVNEVKQPGMHSVQWNARGISSGVFFYRLQAGSFFDTKKMLVIK
jgi:hypothetical protein